MVLPNLVYAPLPPSWRNETFRRIGRGKFPRDLEYLNPAPGEVSVGVKAQVLDIASAQGHWNGEQYAGELTHGRQYNEDEIWDNYEYMIRKVAPVAEEAGVYIGIHPDDPPVYPLGGIPRCMFGNFAGYKKAMDIADSPNIGVCLCVGCWLEGGK